MSKQAISIIIGALLIFAGVMGYIAGRYSKPPLKEVEIKTIKVVERIDYDQNVEEVIERVCREEGINPKVCLAVAKCESNLNPFATNLRDFGLYQFNYRRFKDGQINLKEAIDPELSTRKFVEIVKNEGLKPWDASRKCWEKEIIMIETQK